MKPLFDGKASLDIQSHYRGALAGKPLCPSIPRMGTDGQIEWLLCTLSIMHIKSLMEAIFDGFGLGVLNI